MSSIGATLYTIQRGINMLRTERDEALRLLKEADSQLTEQAARLAGAERTIAEMRGERACQCETLVLAESQVIEAQAKAADLQQAVEKSNELLTHALQDECATLDKADKAQAALKEAMGELRQVCEILGGQGCERSTVDLADEVMARDERMEKALEFYADEKNWTRNSGAWGAEGKFVYSLDRGAIAREALAGKEGENG